MKIRNIKLSVLTFLALGFLSNVALADTKPQPTATMDPKMEAFVKATTPGEEHKLLQKYVGKWTHTLRWWMAEGAKPEESAGTSEIVSIMGGRFIQHTVKGTSMGQPFEGLGITGYDNLQKKYSTIWLDNISTGMMLGTGQFDNAKNALVDEGSFSCPMSPTGVRKYRAVWTLPEGKTFKYELFSNGEDGKEFRMMEIIYTQAK